MINRFRRRSLNAASAAAVFALSLPTAVALAADWPTTGGDDRRAGVSEEKITPPLSLLWRYTALPVSTASAPTVVGKTVYFAGKNNTDANSGGVLFALDTKTGSRKWMYPSDTGLKDKAFFLTSPVIADGKIYIGASDGYLYIVDATNGQEVNKIRTGGSVAGTPVISDGKLYFGSNDNSVYSFDANSFDVSGDWRVPFRAKENINSSLISADGYLFFTTADQNVHGILQSSGRSKWELRLPFKYQPNAAVYADNTLFVPSGPRLFAIQPASGNMRWTKELPGDILAPPTATQGVVYVSCRDTATQQYFLYAIRSSNRREVWAEPTVLPAAPSATPSIVGDIIYVPTRRGVIVAVNREDGNILWTYRAQPSANRANVTLPTETSIQASLAVSDGTIYALTEDGTLSAFRSDAPDNVPPLLTTRYPGPAQAIYGGPGMVIAATVLDPGSGLDTDSLKIAVDGVEMTTGYNAALNLAYYQRKGTAKMVDNNAQLANGRHTVTLTAKDYKGNVLTDTWSFVVDNNLKPPTVNYDPPKKPGGITAPPSRNGRGSGAGK